MNRKAIFAAAGTILLAAALIFWLAARQSMHTAELVGENAAPDAVKLHAELYGAAHENNLRYSCTRRFSLHTAAESYVTDTHMETLAYTGSGIYSIGTPEADETNPGGVSGLCYTDLESGETVYLCAKPECLHDGTEFCNATSSAYDFHALAYFDGMLYAAATKQTGSAEHPFQNVLLACQPDGSGITELAVLSDFGTAIRCEMIAHRGALWVSLVTEQRIKSGDSVLDRDLYGRWTRFGLYHYAIAEQQLTWIIGTREDDESCNADELTDLQGAGDYVYFRKASSRGVGALEEGLYQADARTGVIRKMPLRTGVLWGYTADVQQLYCLMKPSPASEETAGLAELHILSAEDGAETVTMMPRKETLLTYGGAVFLPEAENMLAEYTLPDGAAAGTARFALPEQPEGSAPCETGFGISSDGMLWFFCRQSLFGVSDDGTETHIWDGSRLFLTAQPLGSAPMLSEQAVQRQLPTLYSVDLHRRFPSAQE